MNSFVHEILHDYDALRRQNETHANTRLAQALLSCPELAAWQKEVRMLQSAYTRQKVFENASQTTLSTLENQIKLLLSKKEEMLYKNNLPADLFEPIFSCIACRDTGFMPDGTRCTCFTRRLMNKLYASSQVEKEQTFEAFNPLVFINQKTVEEPEPPRAYMLRVKQKCQDYVKEFPKTEKQNIVFTGKTGTGKTYLLHCIANAVLQRGYTALKVTAYQLQASFFKSEQSVLQKDLLFHADLLLIDDLGTEPLFNNVTVEYLFLILNERTLRRKHTLVSTNLSLIEIKERYGDRLYSRLINTNLTSVIRFFGPDIRTRK